MYVWCRYVLCFHMTQGVLLTFSHCSCYTHAVDWQRWRILSQYFYESLKYTIMNFIVIHRSRSTFLNWKMFGSFFFSRVVLCLSTMMIFRLHVYINLEKHGNRTFLPRIRLAHNFCVWQTRSDDWGAHFSITICHLRLLLLK